MVSFLRFMCLPLIPPIGEAMFNDVIFVTMLNDSVATYSSDYVQTVMSLGGVDDY